MRRRETFIAHREFFHALTIDETVVLACTCRRGTDHWYGEPVRASDHLANEAAPPAAVPTGGATISRLLRRSPDRVARAS
jgi:hypothetical protein